MRIKLLICIFVFLFSRVSVSAINNNDDELFTPVNIKDGMQLSIKECVSVAFNNSPKIKREKYNLDIAKNNVGIAKSQYFPIIQAGAGFFNENNSNHEYYNNHYREFPSVGVTINKLIWDFGRTTAYIKMEDFYRIGAEYEFMDSLCSTLFDVKEKYYNLLKTKALLQVAQNNVEINQNFVKYAQNKKQADLTTAEVNLSDAQIKYLEAKNNFYNAQINLNNAMYLDSQPNYDIQSTYTFAYENDFAYTGKDIKNTFEPEKFQFPLDNAVQIAYENSPDLNVLIATKQAMEQALVYIKKTYLPALVANAGYGYTQSNQTSNNNFQVGVNLTSNVNIMELKHSIQGADAQLNLAENEIILFKKDLYFELKRAFNNVEKTQKQVPIAKNAVIQAIDNLKLVESKYKTNELDYVALQNARKDYISTLDLYINSLYNYNIALIQVEMAMHYHIVDIHHKSEHAITYHSEELIEHLNKVLGCNEKEVKKIKKRKKNLSKNL